MADDSGYVGIQKRTAATDDYNAQLFVIRQVLNSKNFCTLVKVISVTIPGGLALAGTVDVQPLVNQLDGRGNAVPHGVVNGLPYMRMQGGANAIILDPQVGDIGVCVFSDRDISAVKQSKSNANPGSGRRNDMSDGVYIGGLLNGLPTQYVMFTETGIEITSPDKVTITAPVVEINASTSATINTPTFTVNGASQFNGTIDATDTITAPNVIFSGGKSLATHTHSGVQTGGGNSGGPN